MSAHESPDGSHSPSDPNPTVDLPITEGPGTLVGPYKLLQKIGEGGFGVVYMAEQEKPLRRMVALKIIKPGMDTAHVVARFESERQALALMEHPNIAKVFDAGATVTGRPYFVMELVKGVPITEFCDKNHLQPEARLKLFVTVCHAVQHAHHKGVIHRDIKPSNVMVTLHDGVPVPKVIDFGVAKATVQKLTDKTLFTTYGQVIGTPAYMSPEQAEMSGLDIDTRSDVYSLGVLLYELLTGTTPLEGKRLRKAGYLEMQRLIREEEPPRPSTRLSSLGQAATSLAGNRGLDVKRLVQVLSGDLDWVVMKALEKDRTRRYATPDGLAEDVERYLADEPVLAGPPGAAYRLKKYVRRNKGLVLAASVLCFALSGGVIGATWGMVEAQNAQKVEADRAESEKQLRERAEEAQKEARKQETEAKEKLELANAVTDFLVSDLIRQAGSIAQASRGFEPNPDLTVREALDRAAATVGEKFKDRPVLAATIRFNMGEAYYHLGNYDKAIAQYKESVELRTLHLGPEDLLTIRAQHGLALAHRNAGHHLEAIDLFSKVHAARLKQLGPDHQETLYSRNEWAWMYVVTRQLDKAIPMLEEVRAARLKRFGPEDFATLLTTDNLAAAYHLAGRLDESEAMRERSVQGRIKTLGLENSYTLDSLQGLGRLHESRGKTEEALALYQKVLAIRIKTAGAKHPYTLHTLTHIAALHERTGKRLEALDLYKQIHEGREKKLGADHPDTLDTKKALVHLLVQLDLGKDAIPIIDEFFRRDPAKVRDRKIHADLIAIRLAHFRKANDSAGCRQTAVMWEKLNRTDPDSLFTAACLRAVTARTVANDPKTAAADASRLANDEADRALAWLRQAVAAGYTDLATLKENPQLDSLRGRDDFGKLLAALAASSEKK